MSDYTPTTEEVRTAYSDNESKDYKARSISYGDHDYHPSVAGEPRVYVERDSVARREAKAEFDRWLAEVKAQAWEEGYDEGYVDGSCDRERADNPYRQGEN